jgi:uncharacterized protein YecE (DUF72 family)
MTVILAGTSGYSYKPWKGPFYPEDLADRDMLGYYATQLPAVEINNTFYRMPGAKLLERWCEVTPATFRLALKASRRLTHRKKLEPPEDALAYLFEVTAALGERRGPHLFQLPPFAPRDIDGLERLLDRVPEGHRVALEFRHESWFDDATFDVLRARDVAMVVAEGGKIDVPREATASWGYLRLRRDDYSAGDVGDWAAWLSAQDWSEAYVFFKHEDAGVSPGLARALMQQVS